MLEVADASHFDATVDGHAVREIESFCADPVTQRYEFNFKLPERILPGRARSVRHRSASARFAPLGDRGGLILKIWLALGALALAALAVFLPGPRAGFTQLAPGITELHGEMVLGEGAELRGAAGTVLRAAPDFHGRALIVVRGNHVLLRDFTVDGNRRLLEARLGLPPYDVALRPLHSQ